MHYARTAICLCCLVCLSLCSSQLFSEVVANGDIGVTGHGMVVFTLSGSGFTVTGDASNPFGSWPSCLAGCLPGTLLSVDGGVEGNDFGQGTATVGTTYFPFVDWGDLFSEPGSLFLVTGPPIMLGDDGGTYTGTFSFTGNLCGTLDHGNPFHPCVVDLPALTGTGEVLMDMGSFVNNGQIYLNVTQATYMFTTPEPSSLMLLGSGVLGLAGVIRRKINS
jgi:hypothetical protein